MNWETSTITILSVIRPYRTYCSQALEMLSITQRIIPGRTSQKVLISKLGNPGKVGFRGRPRKNFQFRVSLSSRQNGRSRQNITHNVRNDNLRRIRIFQSYRLLLVILLRNNCRCIPRALGSSRKPMRLIREEPSDRRSMCRVRFHQVEAGYQR